MRRMLVVPAAGSGSRLKASLPKLLVPVAGRPMIDHLLELYQERVDRVALVVHPDAEGAVREHLARLTSCTVRVDLAFQDHPTGMLDAILVPARLVRGLAPDRVWITWCDQVAVHPLTVQRLAAIEESQAAAPLVFPTAVGPDPYVHLERDDTGRIVRIRHRREGDAIPATGESEMGLFSLSGRAYLRDLADFARSAEPGSATRERNFLPFIPWMSSRGDVLTFPCEDRMEALGINTPDDLRNVEAYLAGRARQTGAPGDLPT